MVFSDSSEWKWVTQYDSPNDSKYRLGNTAKLKNIRILYMSTRYAWKNYAKLIFILCFWIYVDYCYFLKLEE